MRIKIDPLDKLCSQFVKLRDKWCQRCGGSGGLQTSHFFGRAMKAVRWDPENVCLLCFGCHQYFHAHPLEHVEWYKARLGDEFDLLNGRSRATYPKPDKEGIKLYLKEKIKEMEE